MNQEEHHGRIVKATGGFYYVKTPGGATYECRARGIFRKEEITPYVGDLVTMEETEEEGKGYILSIDERKNELIRPPVSNIDQLLLVVSTTEPTPNFLVLDKLIAIAEYKEIEPVIVVTKADLKEPDAVMEIYGKAGFPVYAVDSLAKEGIEPIKALFPGKITALTGNTGVGKSTLLNAVAPQLSLDTSEISQKLGRGRHTTRHVELFEVEGGYVADTPGFSAVEVGSFETIFKDELAGCFREFGNYVEDCKFRDCSHVKGKGCAVIEAVEAGEIPPSRHQSYLAMYEDASKLNEWEHKK